jgi:hypothetical protein
MADLSDVEIALLGCVTAAVYPEGVSAPSGIGTTCRVFRGWPIPGALNSDLAAGVVNISIAPDTVPGRTTTRYAPTWSMTVPSATLTATVNETVVTFAGTAGSGLAAGICINRQKVYVYRPQPHDTPQLVAANLAVQIRKDFIALLAGASIGVPGAQHLDARVAPDGIAMQEARRQQREIRVIAWCPTPSLRDVTSSIVDTFLAARSFVLLDDGTVARLTYHGTQVFDQSQNALLYRRDLVYTAEYATMIALSAPSMLFGNLIVNADQVTV